MIPGPQSRMPQKILSSWKEIASYLGHSRRTVQRWERELSLPIHRPAGRESHSVMAFAAQLDEWLQSFTSHPAAKKVEIQASPLSFYNEPHARLEMLLQEEDSLFEQLQNKRAEIREERAQQQRSSNAKPDQ